MSYETQLFENLLKENKNVVTSVRRAIFLELLNAGEPVDMSTLLDSLSANLDRASVYRNIELFEKLGIIHKVHSGWKYKIELSDKFQTHHHHFTCDHCGSVISLTESPNIEKNILSLAKKNNLRLKSHSLELRGYCPSCS